HQRRAGRLGPRAVGAAAGLLRARGYTVSSVTTPWHLTAANGQLLDAWLCGRAAAAGEQAPGRRHDIDGWLTDRLSALDGDRLQAHIGHLDIVGLPPTAD